MTNELISLCNELIEDENILSVLKKPIIEIVNSGNIKLNENQEDIEYLIENLYESFNQCFPELINSVEQLKICYSEIYTLNKNLFDTIEKIAIQYKLCNECWLRMNEDKDLAMGISRMVALWLTSDYSAKEKEDYYIDINNEIHNNVPEDLIKSVTLVKSKYSVVYDFRKVFFDDLQEDTLSLMTKEDLNNIEMIENSNVEKILDKFKNSKLNKIFSKK